MNGEGKGAFITVEGPDGSGKTTHIDFIQQWLGARGARVVRTREPGGTALGERLRELLLATDGADGADGENSAPIFERAELLLFFAARAQHIDEVISPALASGEWVLSDRFTDATYAYQGGGRGMAMADIAILEQWTQGALQPDLTLLLDVPPEVGRARVLQQDLIGLNPSTGDDRARADRFEAQSLAFNKAVHAAYKKRAAKFKERIKLINADQSIDAVRAELEVVLETFWRERPGLRARDSAVGGMNGCPGCP